MRYIEERIGQLKSINRAPTVGPYTVTKKGAIGEDGVPKPDYTVTTEVWELDSAIVRFEYPKGGKKNPSGFNPREAKGLGQYLGRNHGQGDKFVEVMLIDGLEPTVSDVPEKPNYIIGRAEIRCKCVTSSTGGETRYWLFVKIRPLEGEDLAKKPELQLEISHCIGSRMTHYLRAYGTDYNGMQVGFLPIK